MHKKDNPLLLFTLVCIVVGLFASLAPFSVIESHGLVDSSVTEDLLMLPVLLTVTGLLLLLTRLCSAYFAVPQLFSSLLVPPPISN
ncbi:MAG: hypothetical protein NT121_04030 [Chloroflexi bacterium]|nr:hypothetical protein [Chloroflexota bacterium]